MRNTLEIPAAIEKRRVSAAECLSQATSTFFFLSVEDPDVCQFILKAPERPGRTGRSKAELSRRVIGERRQEVGSECLQWQSCQSHVLSIQHQSVLTFSVLYTHPAMSHCAASAAVKG